MLWRGKAIAVVACVAVALVAGSCTNNPTGGGMAPTGSGCMSPPVIGPGASLYNCSLIGLDLSGVDLTGADLRGSDLTGADLSGANLTNANLSGANLTGANLTGADMAGAILSGAILLGALFLGANLLGAVFDFGGFTPPAGGSTGGGGAVGTPVGACTGPYCAGYNEATVDTGVDVCGETYGADLGVPSFYLHQDSDTLAVNGRRSVVTDAATDFTGAVLGGTQFAFRGLSLSKANFTNAVIHGVSVGCQDGSGGRFDGATFVGGELIDITLPNTTAVGATFVDLHMCSVNLSDSDLDGAKFRGETGSTCTDIMNAVPSRFSAIVMFERSSLVGAQFGDPALLGEDPAGTAPNGWYRSAWVNYTGDGKPSVTFQDADLTSASATYPEFRNARFTGATLSSFVSQAQAQPALYDSVDFTTADWTGATFTGPHDYTGSSCPDGTVAGPGDACF